jgi:Flp pilus assembly pilin Flp
MDSRSTPQKQSSFPTQCAAALADESGVAAIEYGLLAALVLVAAMVSFTAFGSALADLFQYWSEAVAQAIGQVP